jgi:succinate dehydrogenase/fumarate reductase flavoprotein subunit
MWETAGLIWQRDKMENGLESLAALPEESEKHLAVSPNHRFNRELLDAFELLNLIQISSLILRSALAREEIRGAQYWKDFPYPDDAKWLVNIILKKNGEKIDLRKEKVRFTYLRPEGMGYENARNEQGASASVRS